MGYPNALQAVTGKLTWHGRVYTARDGKDKDRAAHSYGRGVVRGVAIHNRIPAPGILEGAVCDCDLAVLPGSAFQRVAALSSHPILPAKTNSPPEAGLPA